MTVMTMKVKQEGSETSLSVSGMDGSSRTPPCLSMYMGSCFHAKRHSRGRQGRPVFTLSQSTHMMSHFERQTRRNISRVKIHGALVFSDDVLMI